MTAVVDAADLAPQSLTLESMPRTVWLATVELRLGVDVSIVRQPRRRRCAICLTRRVLYRVRVTNGSTEARCAPCWGIRE